MQQEQQTLSQALSGVSETLLIPLFCRAWESAAAEAVLRDPQAEALAAQLEPVLKRQAPRFYKRFLKRRPQPLVTWMALRARHFDQTAAAFLEQHPAGQVVQLACGLDTRFQRIGGPARYPEAQWLELDLPAVIELRQRWGLQQTPFYAGSVLEPGWLELLDPARPSLLLIEGLLMYLPRSQTQLLFQRLAEHFEQAEIAAEFFAHWLARLTADGPLKHSFQFKFGLNSAVTFQGGLYHSHEPEHWHPRLKFDSEWSFFDEKNRFQWLNPLGLAFRHVQWVVHYSLRARS